jgi:hypothetical protein
MRRGFVRRVGTGLEAEESAELKKAAAGGWGFSDEERQDSGEAFPVELRASQTSVGCRRTPGGRASASRP